MLTSKIVFKKLYTPSKYEMIGHWLQNTEEQQLDNSYQGHAHM